MSVWPHAPDPKPAFQNCVFKSFQHLAGLPGLQPASMQAGYDPSFNSHHVQQRDLRTLTACVRENGPVTHLFLC